MSAVPSGEAAKPVGWIVGVDAGGTTTRALALETGTGRLREGRAPGANWTVHGPERCGEHIGAAVREALAGASPAAVCLCIAGYYPPDHAARAVGWAQSLWPDSKVRLEPDVLAAWAGAHGGEAGIVLISGTGSICYGQGSSGQSARAGGWGPLFGDEGSAYEVGVGALRLLAAREDGMEPPGGLEARVMARWPELGVDLRSWLRGIYRCKWGREQVAALAEEVARAAAEGDAGCAGVLARAAEGLARQAAAVERKLGETGLPLAVQGGFGRSAAGLLSLLERRLADWGSSLRLVESRLSPLSGSVLLAATTLGGPELARSVREVLE